MTKRRNAPVSVAAAGPGDEEVAAALVALKELAPQILQAQRDLLAFNPLEETPEMKRARNTKNPERRNAAMRQARLQRSETYKMLSDRAQRTLQLLEQIAGRPTARPVHIPEKSELEKMMADLRPDELRVLGVVVARIREQRQMLLPSGAPDVVS